MAVGIKTYIVSGAGSGIGRAVCTDLAKASPEHRVVLVGRNEVKLRETLASLPRPEAHSLVVADVRDGGALRAGFESLRLHESNVVGVVANAGVGGSNLYSAEPGKDRWEQVISTNLTGTYVFVNETLPLLRTSTDSYRHVVVISSILARQGVPGYSAYCASKAGLLGLVRSWATEWAREKILVNAVCPGWVDTAMAEQGISLIAGHLKKPFDETLREQLATQPLRKMSTPAEIAALTSFLLSGKQISMTGQALDINNGATMP